VILIAIGANLPGRDATPPLATCAAAADSLRGLVGLRLVAVSPWYRTAPVPPSGQPDYVNGVARLAGEAEPAALLAALQAIEARAGRVRGAANAARPLDLDIIDLNGLVRDSPDPVLPHPRAHLRGFVLVPLAEVAPDWVHPRLEVGPAALLAGLPPYRVVPL
jgi:2-amino-4-hydroxy-6-hydroxymethyldihydropteridine diphosphokinase